MTFRKHRLKHTPQYIHTTFRKNRLKNKDATLYTYTHTHTNDVPKVSS